MWRTFLKVLRASVTKHGADKVVTLGHLLNLVMLTASMWAKEETMRQEEIEKIINDSDEARYGKG
jgi:hypothetical protein